MQDDVVLHQKFNFISSFCVFCFVERFASKMHNSFAYLDKLSSKLSFLQQALRDDVECDFCWKGNWNKSYRLLVAAFRKLFFSRNSILEKSSCFAVSFNMRRFSCLSIIPTMTRVVFRKFRIEVIDCNILEGEFKLWKHSVVWAMCFNLNFLASLSQ